MKKIIRLLLNFITGSKNKEDSRPFHIFIMLIIFASLSVAFPKQTQAQVSIGFQVFYDELGPYGNWISNAEYGYVWQPYQNNDFFPYGTNGYWIYSDMGWTWYSNYSWGWAPFHYGRWLYDAFYGWIWVPGYDWAPAWVTWRQCPSFYGWAPLGPDITFEIAFGSSYYIPYDRWRFVHQHDFGRRDIDQHFAGIGGYVKYLENSIPIDNIHQDHDRNIRYHAGPQIKEVKKVTGKGFAPVIIKSLITPQQNITKKELQIFKPEIKRTTIETAIPKVFQQWHDIKPEKKQPIKQLPEKIIQEPERNIPQLPQKEEQPQIQKTIPRREPQAPPAPRVQQPTIPEGPEIEKKELQPEVKPKPQERRLVPPEKIIKNPPVQDKLQPIRKTVPERKESPERPVFKKPTSLQGKNHDK